MNKQEQEKANMELEFKRKQFINEISLVSQILGIEIDFYLKTNEKGYITPYMHLGNMEKISEEKKKEYIEVLEVNRTAWMKMLGFQDTAIEPKVWADQYITEDILNNDKFNDAFMQVIDKVEREYQMTMKPIIVGSLEGIIGSYEVIEKIFTPDVEKPVATEEKTAV